MDIVQTKFEVMAEDAISVLRRLSKNATNVETSFDDAGRATIKFNSTARVSKNTLDKFADEINKAKRSTEEFATTTEKTQKTVKTAMNSMANSATKCANVIKKQGQGIRNELKRQTEMFKYHAKAMANMHKHATSIFVLAGKLSLITYGIRRLSTVFGTGVKKANEYIESLNLFSVALGRDTVKAKKFLETMSASFGLDEAKMTKTMGLFYQISNSLGLSSEKAYTLSENFTKLAYDLSSLYDIDYDAAVIKLMAGLVGETEPLRRLGIVITENNLAETAHQLGIHKSIRNMTEAEKIQLRYVTALNQTKNAQGDLSRTFDQPANQIRIWREQVSVLSREFGTVFIPALEKVLPYVSAFTKALADLLHEFNSSRFDLGAHMKSEVTKSHVYEDILDASKGYEDSMKKTEEASARMRKNLQKVLQTTKSLQSSMLGIDELNVLNSDDGSGLGVASVEGTINKAQGLIDVLFKGYNNIIGDALGKFEQTTNEIKTKIINVGKTISSIFEPATKKLQELHKLIKGDTDANDIIDFLKSTAEILNDIIEGIANAGISIINNIIKPLDEMFRKNFGENYIQDFVDTLTKPIVHADGSISSILTDVTELIVELKIAFKGFSLLKGVIFKVVGKLLSLGKLGTIGLLGAGGYGLYKAHQYYTGLNEQKTRGEFIPESTVLGQLGLQEVDAFLMNVNAFINKTWKSVSEFFTIKIPEFFKTVSDFFTVTIPEKVEDIKTDITTFFTETLPNDFLGVIEYVKTSIDSILHPENKNNEGLPRVGLTTIFDDVARMGKDLKDSLTPSLKFLFGTGGVEKTLAWDMIANHISDDLITSVYPNASANGMTFRDSLKLAWNTADGPKNTPFLNAINNWNAIVGGPHGLSTIFANSKMLWNQKTSQGDQALIDMIHGDMNGALRLMGLYSEPNEEIIPRNSLVADTLNSINTSVQTISSTAVGGGLVGDVMNAFTEAVGGKITIDDSELLNYIPRNSVERNLSSVNSTVESSTRKKENKSLADDIGKEVSMAVYEAWNSNAINDLAMAMIDAEGYVANSGLLDRNMLALGKMFATSTKGNGSSLGTSMMTNNMFMTNAWSNQLFRTQKQKEYDEKAKQEAEQQEIEKHNKRKSRWEDHHVVYDWFANIFSKTGGVFKSMGTWIKEAFATAGNAIKDYATKAWEWFSNISWVDWIIQESTPFIKLLGDGFKFVFDVVKGFGKAMKYVTNYALIPMFDVYKKNVAYTRNEDGSVSSNFHDIVEDDEMKQEIGGQMVGGITNAIGGETNLWYQVALAVSDGSILAFVQDLPEMVEVGVQFVKNIVSGVVRTLPMIIDVLTDPDFLATIIGALLELVTEIVLQLPNIFVSLIEAIPKIFMSVVEAIFKINWLNVGWNLMVGIIQGLINAAAALLEQAMNILLIPYNAIAWIWGGQIDMTGKIGRVDWSGEMKDVMAGYASGGFPPEGQLFVAREAGAEMVGSIGGRTAVANNDQIVEAVSDGVYRAVTQALHENKSDDKSINVYLDGKKIYDNQRTVADRTGLSFGMGGL